MKYKVIKTIKMTNLLKAECPYEGLIWFNFEARGNEYLSDNIQSLVAKLANKSPCWIQWLIDKKFIEAAERTYALGDEFDVDGSQCKLVKIGMVKCALISMKVWDRWQEGVTVDVHNITSKDIEKMAQTTWEYIRSAG